MGCPGDDLPFGREALGTQGSVLAESKTGKAWTTGQGFILLACPERPGQTRPDVGPSLSLGLSSLICRRSRRALIFRTNIVWLQRGVGRRKGLGVCRALPRVHPLYFSGALTASLLEKKRMNLLPASVALVPGPTRVGLLGCS